MNVRRLLIQAAIVGVEAGFLALLLVLRLNPEVRPGGPGLAFALGQWGAWGAVTLGTLLFAAGLAACRRRRRERTVAVAAGVVSAGVLASAAVLAWTDAETLQAFLSGRGHRILGQDAISLLAVGIVVAFLGRAARRTRGNAVCWGTFLLALLTPVIRLVVAPTPPPPAPVTAPAAAEASPPLLVVGIEGLDTAFLLTNADSDRFPAFRHLLSAGAWGAVQPFTPFLRTALWTSAATGCSPARHGVKSSRAWRLPGLRDVPIQVLPWTPLGDRLFLPPWAVPVRTPPARVPRLWRRLAGRGGAAVIGWPRPGGEPDATGTGRYPGVPGDLLASFRAVAATFGTDGKALLEALSVDSIRTARAVEAARHGAPTVWVVLESLSEARRRFEPLGPEDADRRAVMGLELEAMDALLGDLLEAWAGRGPAVVLSPYGMARPKGWERVRRFLGGGDRWRVSPRACPDGALVLLAQGVDPGHRFSPCDVVDVVPTVTYLLGLPLPAWAEGRVILDAISPAYLEETPLVVAD